MRGKAKIKTTQFLKTSLILVLTLSLSIFTFLALFMSHQSASTIREISQMYMSSMGDQIAMHFETTIGLRLDQLVSMVQTVLPADAHASPSQEQDLITNAQARDFTHLAFYRTDGSFDMMYGAEVELTDPEPFMASVLAGEDRKSVV